jgi:uncharacterized protein
VAYRDVIHFDQGDVLRHELTPEGFLNCYMRVSKVGDLQYRNADGSTRTEHVSKDSLFNTDSVKSLKMKPVTFEHPPALLTAETAKGYSTGSTGHLTVPDGSFLGITAVIHDKPTIDAILSGKAREVSCGYTCDLVKRSDGSYEQQNRQYNHVAITKKGRAGNSVAVHMDSVSDANIWTQIRGDSMSDELFQIDIAGSVTRVDAETYQLIQQERRDAEKKMSAMAAKMAKLRAMQSDAPDEDEDEEDEDEEMPVVKKGKASCGTRKDGYKGKAKAEPMVEEDMEEEDDDEDMRKDSFAHTDSADAALLEAMIENRLLKARLDAENADMAVKEDESEDESEDEEMDNEEVMVKKRKDAADILNTWIAVSDELMPALVRGDSVVEGIEVEDGKLRFDSVDATDLKEAYIKVMKFDDLLEDSNRYDSLAIDTMFKLARKVKARVDAAEDVATPKNRSRETLDSALSNNKRQDASDVRFTSMQADIEAGRKRIGR